jgi:hypothetical protein
MHEEYEHIYEQTDIKNKDYYTYQNGERALDSRLGGIYLGGCCRLTFFFFFFFFFCYAGGNLLSKLSSKRAIYANN